MVAYVTGFNTSMKFPKVVDINNLYHKQVRPNTGIYSSLTGYAILGPPVMRELEYIMNVHYT